MSLVAGRLQQMLLVIPLVLLLGLAGCSSGGSGGGGNTPTQPDNGGGGDGGTGGGDGDTGGGDDGNGEPEEPEPTIAQAQAAALSDTRVVLHDLMSARLSGAHWVDGDYLEPVRPVAGDPDAHPAASVRLALDAQGDGFAAWARGNTAYVSQYSRDLTAWSVPQAVSASTVAIGEVQLAVDRDTGDAFVVWQQGDGGLQTLYANRFDAAGNAWETPQSLSAEMLPAGTAKNLYVSARNGRAAVTWSESDGLPNVCATDDAACTVYMKLYDAGSWGSRITVQDSADKGEYPEVALDRDGNAMVIWQLITDTGMQVRARQWIAASAMLEPVSRQLNDIGGDRHPRIGIDGAGNVFVLWRQGGAYVRRFDVNMGWQPTTRLTEVGASFIGGEVGEIAVDENGNALAVWVEHNGTDASVYARRYDKGSGLWASAQEIEDHTLNANGDAIPALAINGARALVAWQEDGAPARDLFAVYNDGAAWAASHALEDTPVGVLEAVAAMDEAGNAAVLWVQADGFLPAIHQSLYLAPGYVIPAGATWQSLAAELYDVDSPEAGTALQTAQDGMPAAGRRLSGLPDPLAVDTPVTPYYVVQPGDTLSHIAQAVYGSHDVAIIEQLRQQLGDPALTPGMELEVPAELAYFPSTEFSAPLDNALIDTAVVDQYSLDDEALIVPQDEWSAAGLMEDANVLATSPSVAFDDQGRGVAVWAQENDVLVRRYTPDDGWAAVTIALDVQTQQVFEPRLALDRATGNAAVAWVQSDGTELSLYASIYDAAADTWTAPYLVEANDDYSVPTAPEVMSVAISGSHVALAWVQFTLPGDRHAYVARAEGGVWTAPEQLDVLAVGETVEEPGIAVAIDAAANVIALWRQNTGLWGSHWQTGSAAPGVPRQFDTGGRFPKIAFDAAGNAIALWENGGPRVERYDAVNGWEGASSLAVAGALHVDLALDAAGDAIVAWVEGDAVVNDLKARLYDAATDDWLPEMQVKSSADPVHYEVPIALDFNGDQAVIAWAQQGAERDVNVSRLMDGVWISASALLDDQSLDVSRVAAGVGPDGDAAVLWQQPDAFAPSIFFAETVSDPYYLVSASDTWQTLANVLYGVDSTDAADALQAALPGVTLAADLRLRGMPATLAVTTAVPQYYLVQSGDTWVGITLALYGTDAPEAVAALRAALGDPALNAGARLEVADTLSYEIPEA